MNVKPDNGNANPIVQIAWVELNTATGDATLKVSANVTDALAFAKMLAALSCQYAAERALAASRIERATLEQVRLASPIVVQAAKPARQKAKG